MNLDEVKNRLRVLEDVEEIKKLQREYVRVKGIWKFMSLKYTRPWRSTIRDHAKEDGDRNQQ